MSHSFASLRTQDFDYHLPSVLIAQTPAEPRDASRLMVVSRQDGAVQHRHFSDIVDYLRPGDVLVCNQSRVIPARLRGRKRETGGQVEALLIGRREEDVWEALVKPGRRLREGMIVEFRGVDAGVGESGTTMLVGAIGGRTAMGGRLIRFANIADSDSGIEKVLESLGVVPLPPYIHASLRDPERYQTVYAREKGSVAAPTAGLHFTPELMAHVRAIGAEFAFVTLHIGLDTFRPVQVENLVEHKMHSEYCELSEESAAMINAARREGRRIIAVGTTSVRVLESAAQDAMHRRVASGCPELAESLVMPFHGPTEIFIYPGYKFRAVDALITNFHLPRSTLLMLVSAFASKEIIDRAYSAAIAEGYRFYSFGDAMFLR